MIYIIKKKTKKKLIALNPQLSEYERKDAKFVTGNIMGMKSHFGMGSKNLKKCPTRTRKNERNIL